MSEGKLYVGLHWSNHVEPSGVYVSNLGAGGMVFKPFGAIANYTGLIVWTLARDEQNDILYAGTEIYDHPQPYSPPFFRSANDGTNWTNVNSANALPWHVIDSAVRPGDGYVYALTEGYGVYGSATKGSSWTPPTLSPGLGVVMLMDPQLPTRLYAGRHEYGTLNGGLYLSNDGGKTYKPIGLQDVTVADVALNGNGTRVYAATYGSGIYVHSCRDTSLGSRVWGLGSGVLLARVQPHPRLQTPDPRPLEARLHRTAPNALSFSPFPDN